MPGPSDAESLVAGYYAAFNAGDRPAMLALLTDDVIHDINQGAREVGKPAFAAFLTHMDLCYRERLLDIVIMLSADGTRAAAEFFVEGEYIETDGGMSPAHGQRYRLPAGTFFEIRDGRIARVTTHYNMKGWIAQLGG